MSSGTPVSSSTTGGRSSPKMFPSRCRRRRFLSDRGRLVWSYDARWRLVKTLRAKKDLRNFPAGSVSSPDSDRVPVCLLLRLDSFLPLEGLFRLEPRSGEPFDGTKRTELKSTTKRGSSPSKSLTNGAALSFPSTLAASNPPHTSVPFSGEPRCLTCQLQSFHSIAKESSNDMMRHWDCC